MPTPTLKPFDRRAWLKAEADAHHLRGIAEEAQANALLAHAAAEALSASPVEALRQSDIAQAAVLRASAHCHHENAKTFRLRAEGG